MYEQRWARYRILEIREGGVSKVEYDTTVWVPLGEPAPLGYLYTPDDDEGMPIRRSERSAATSGV